MGKTAKGAVWLDPEMLPPYEYYQYWVNTDDRDVERFLGLFTFLPMDEVRRLGALKDADIREAKQILAFEATSICHGREAAEAAKSGAEAAFKGQGSIDDMPTTEISRRRVDEGLRAAELFVELGLCESKGQATKLFRGGGGFIGERQVKDHTDVLRVDDFSDGEVMLRAGKKQRKRLVLTD